MPATMTPPTKTDLPQLAFEATEAFARKLDKGDSLKKSRKLFHLPKGADGEDAIYFCGNSLGLQPKSAAKIVKQEMDDWASMAVDGHFHGTHPWYSYHEMFREPGARLVGAEPGEVVMMNSLTVNLHLMLISFYRATRKRKVILTDSPTFPSDLYALKSHLRSRWQFPKRDIVFLKPREGEHVIREEDIYDTIDELHDDLSVVFLNGVNFLTGQVFDIKEITKQAHGVSRDVMVGWNLAHAVGNVPLQLHTWNVDFAVWCSYKYLNAGPGAVGGAFVHDRHGKDDKLNRYAGWWGVDPKSRFDLHRKPKFIPVEGAEGWQISNPQILSLAPLKASLDIFDEFGMEALREKSITLTGFLRFLLEQIESDRFTIITPSEIESQGSQLSILLHADPTGCFEALRSQGVVCDFRQPDIIRVAPTPLYNTFDEVWRFAQIFEKIMQQSTATAGAEQERRARHRTVAQRLHCVVMTAVDESTMVIVGAGLSGSLMACYLGRAGCRVAVYEKRPDPRVHGFLGGRSINLALSTRGITALRDVGLDQKVLDESVPMPGRMIHGVDGTLTYQPYSKDPSEFINSTDRARLNLIMLEAADTYDNVSLHFGYECISIDPDAPCVMLQSAESGLVEINPTLVIGADGAYSAVRGRLQKQDRFDYSQNYLEYGYKELTIPPRNGEYAMEPNALHIWPRGGSMMIALPNPDKSFVCTCFWPFDGPNSFSSVHTREQAVRHFEAHFADAVPLMPTLADDFMNNPVGSMVTVRCKPWHYEDKVVLIGDAAHAIVPFYGQGINAGFEDCRVLNEVIQVHTMSGETNWAAALEQYSIQRKPAGDAIADLALHNFVEMRDHVGKTTFLLRKKAEKLLHKLFPGWYVPLYNLISFSNVPYHVARLDAEVRDRIVLATIIGLIVALMVVLGSLL